MKLQTFREEENLPKTFSSVFERVFNDALKSSGLTSFNPSIDVSEDDNQYEVWVNVPGLKKEDFNLEMHGNMLTISGEKKFEKQEGKRYHVVESGYGSFSRSFSLPEDANPRNITAEYHDGVLKITIPKDPEKSSSKRIEIK